jgi:predicted amidophosphoribosyltransferase
MFFFVCLFVSLIKIKKRKKCFNRNQNQKQKLCQSTNVKSLSSYKNGNHKQKSSEQREKRKDSRDLFTQQKVERNKHVAMIG